MILLTGESVLANLQVWQRPPGVGCVPCEVQPPMQPPSHSIDSCLPLPLEDMMLDQDLKMKAPAAHLPSSHLPSSLNPALADTFTLDIV